MVDSASRTWQTGSGSSSTSTVSSSGSMTTRFIRTVHALGLTSIRTTVPAASWPSNSASAKTSTIHSPTWTTCSLGILWSRFRSWPDDWDLRSTRWTGTQASTVTVITLNQELVSLSMQPLSVLPSSTRTAAAATVLMKYPLILLIGEKNHTHKKCPLFYIKCFKILNNACAVSVNNFFCPPFFIFIYFYNFCECVMIL